tara:strand:- start:12654 stop:13244 length:591 start_codon:yes stop_codon:yes gene_type:complete
MSKQSFDGLDIKTVRAGKILHRALLACGEVLIARELYKGRHEVRELGLKRFTYNSIELDTVLLCYIDTDNGPEVFVSDGAIALGPIDAPLEKRRAVVTGGAPDLAYTGCGMRSILEENEPPENHLDVPYKRGTHNNSFLSTGAAVDDTYWVAAEMHVCPRDFDELSLWQEERHSYGPIIFKGITGRGAIVMPKRVG